MLTCAFENGAKTSLRHVVVDAIVIKNDEILLVKRAPHLVNGGKYALPGGYLDRDETTKDAVVREVLEETGYTCEIEALFCINDDPKRSQEDRQNVAFFYITKVVKKTGSTDKESTEIRWFPLNTLPDRQEFAFDHYKMIATYKDYLKKSFSLPLFLFKCKTTKPVTLI